MPRILIVDDEPAIVMAVRDELAFEGFEVDSVGDGLAAAQKALEFQPDVILLDLMLPGLNGFEVCRQLRSQLPQVWVILLTVRGQEADRVTGFETGADDYVTKPFSLRELVARIKVGLRRQRNPTRNVLTFGGIHVDVAGRQVTRWDAEVPLTRREFDILALLLEHPGEVVTRDVFCERIWKDVTVTHRVIDTHVASLRRKLEDDASNPKHILSVRGVGYKLA